MLPDRVSNLGPLSQVPYRLRYAARLNNDNNSYKNNDINKNVNISIHKLTPKLIT